MYNRVYDPRIVPGSHRLRKRKTLFQEAAVKDDIYGKPCHSQTECNDSLIRRQNPVHPYQFK